MREQSNVLQKENHTVKHGSVNDMYDPRKKKIKESISPEMQHHGRSLGGFTFPNNKCIESLAWWV